MVGLSPPQPAAAMSSPATTVCGLNADASLKPLGISSLIHAAKMANVPPVTQGQFEATGDFNRRRAEILRKKIGLSDLSILLRVEGAEYYDVDRRVLEVYPPRVAECEADPIKQDQPEYLMNGQDAGTISVTPICLMETKTRKISGHFAAQDVFGRIHRVSDIQYQSHGIFLGYGQTKWTKPWSMSVIRFTDYPLVVGMKSDDAKKWFTNQHQWFVRIQLKAPFYLSASGLDSATADSDAQQQTSAQYLIADMTCFGVTDLKLGVVLREWRFGEVPETSSVSGK